MNNHSNHISIHGYMMNAMATAANVAPATDNMAIDLFTQCQSIEDELVILKRMLVNDECGDVPLHIQYAIYNLTDALNKLQSILTDELNRHIETVEVFHDNVVELGVPLDFNDDMRGSD